MLKLWFSRSQKMPDSMNWTLILTYKLQLVEFKCSCAKWKLLWFLLVLIVDGRSERQMLSGWKWVGAYTSAHILKTKFTYAIKPNGVQCNRAIAKLFNKVELVFHIRILLFLVVNRISKTFNRINLDATVKLNACMNWIVSVK